MEKQEIRTFGRRHGKKLSARQQTLVDELLPTLLPETGDILEIGFGAGEHVRDLARENPDKIIIGAEPFMNGVASLLSAITDKNSNRVLDEYKNIRIWADDVRDFLRTTDSKFEQIWVLHPESNIDSTFLFYLIQSESFIAAANISSGTKMPRAEWSKVSNESFFIPELSEQKRIADLFSAIDKRIVNASRSVNKMQSLKQGLLQQLFI